MKRTILCVFMSLVVFWGFTAEIMLADEENVSEFLSPKSLEVGSPIVVYDNLETGEKVTVQILNTQSVGRSIDSGVGNWSGGSIPPETYPILATYESPNYEELSFVVTYDGAEMEILDIYDESLFTRLGVISDLSSRIVLAKATSSANAKAQMNWIYTQDYWGTCSCYLRIEFNSNNQFRVAWRINN